jgi:DNA repair exonuclease SbcCD ATPase subunit
MRGKENDINNHVKTIEASIERNRKEIAKINKDAYMLENLQVGATCSICFGTVAKENYEKVLNHKKEGIKDLENENDSLGIALSGSQATFQGAKNNTQKALAMQVEIKNKVKATEGKILLIKQRIKELISIEKPDTSHQNRLIQEQISSLEDKVFSIKHELNGGNPYKSIIKTIGNELSECQKKLAGISQNIDDATKELTYYNFWIDGFSEDGIRKVLLDDIIPTLNNKIAYYLHFLINDKLKVVFDNNLNEVIERCPPDGDAFAYNATSGGEKKRIDLSISQAFSYIMSISSGTSPSIVMLDEVGAFFDKDGIEGVYRLICELATERQVIVVTHDQVLLDLLENCETITIAKKDGFSTLEE